MMFKLPSILLSILSVGIVPGSAMAMASSQKIAETNPLTSSTLSSGPNIPVAKDVSLTGTLEGNLDEDLVSVFAVVESDNWPEGYKGRFTGINRSNTSLNKDELIRAKKGFLWRWNKLIVFMSENWKSKVIFNSFVVSVGISNEQKKEIRTVIDEYLMSLAYISDIPTHSP